MKKIVLALILLAFGGCAVFTPIQKTKLISVLNLIEASRFNDAKEALDEMVEDEQGAATWPRTWYAQALLAHQAYREGIRRNDRKLTTLYPDQLYEAWNSYEIARLMDSKGRLDKKLAPRYVLLANDFQQAGERHFNRSEFDEALKAFEQAIEITKSPLLEVETDTNLIYNAAIAAFESSQWDKAVKHLKRLNNNTWTANIPHLLFSAALASGDTLLAERSMLAGIDQYNGDELLVLLLTDLYLGQRKYQMALQQLDKALLREPENPRLHHTKGIVYQRKGDFAKAIAAYTEAYRLAPDDAMSCVNIAACYYNIGVEIEEAARRLTINSAVLREKEKSAEAFTKAEEWLNMALAIDELQPDVLQKMYELYKALKLYDRAESIRLRLDL